MDRGAWQGYRPWGLKRIRYDLVSKQQQHYTHTHTHTHTHKLPGLNDLKIITVKLHALFSIELLTKRAFPGGSVVKNLPANAGDTEDSGSIPGSVRSPGGRHGKPLQYSCLENPLDSGASWATVYRVAELDTT